MISLNLSEPRDPARHRSGQPGQPSSHRARPVSATTSSNPIPILSTYNCASPDEDGMVRALEGALADGRLSSEDIQYANAHETGTAANDEAEIRAIKRVGRRLEEHRTEERRVGT